MADDRTYIKLHDGMPGHPKVRGLSDKAFRTFVSALCYCSEYLTDGEVVVAVAKDLGPTKTWAELVSVGLVETTPRGYAMHDYLQHQRSSEQVQALKEAKRRAGSKGGRAKAAARQSSSKDVAPASPIATDVPRSKTGSKTYPETESLPYGRDQTEGSEPKGSGRKRPPLHEVTDDEDPSARTLVAWYVDRHTRRPPGNVVGQVAKHVGALLDEGFEPDAIKAGLDALIRKRLHPSTLPSLVNDAGNAPAVDPDRRFTGSELDDLLGADRWTCPNPPAGLDPDAEWEWRRQRQIEHIEERQQQARQRAAVRA